MKSAILSSYAFNLHYASKLIEGIAPEKACEQPAGIPNHAAWVIGHLASSSGFISFLLGKPIESPAGWDELFGIGSKPTSDKSKYPPVAELFEAMKLGHADITKLYAAAGDDLLSSPTAHEGFRKMFPTTGDAVGFMLATHEPIHLGQLSAWRRAMGLGSAL